MKGKLIGFGREGAGRNRKARERCADVLEISGATRETFAVDPKVAVFVDERPAKLADLRIGDAVETSGQPVTEIKVLRDGN